MKYLFSICATVAIGLCGATPATANMDPERWADYLDFAYVYSSADAQTLAARLDQYGQEAGLSLDEYMLGYLGAGSKSTVGLSEEKIRRTAIGFLLQYLVTREPKMIDRGAESIVSLQGPESTYEDRYWYHYILAHQALEKGDADEFVRQNLDLWLKVMIPLEGDFDTFDSLSLSQSANSGFVSAVPYLFENQARLILLRSQEMSINQHLDPLAALVRLLLLDRVGAHPDVIPPDASSFAYLQRIVERLDGPESDAGSLTFTLALFEAGKYHDQVRSLLASDGFTAETLKAIRVASGAYEVALERAGTPQGRVAVNVRALRLLGEIYGAKQRLQVDPTIKTPFSIEGAIAVYEEMYQYRDGSDWRAAGYKHVGKQAYIDAMQGLWAEIQETTLNAADYYLARSIARSSGDDSDVRSASQMYASYLAFFHQYAQSGHANLIPDSAYFAAYESAKGYSDALLRFGSSKLTRPEIEMTAQRYTQALHLFPFDRTLWGALAQSMEQLKRSKDYLGLAHKAAERVRRSRHLDTWIQNRESGYVTLATLRRALSDDVVLMYLGFAAGSGMDELEAGLIELEAERDALRRKLAGLLGAGDAPGPAKAASDPVRPLAQQRQIAAAQKKLADIERKVEERSRALPLYKSTLGTAGLIDELRAQRNHPAHTLLRRMFYEKAY